MKKILILMLPAILMTGCSGLTPFNVAIDSDPQGARIDVNGDYIGKTPTSYVVKGNADRSFNGSWVQGGDIVFTASPPYDQTNLYVQTKSFSPSAFFKQGDHIPENIFFDLHIKPDDSNGGQIHINIDTQ